jgi:beta-1,4-mannosyl-glycoprotein beta-1,4-N-acetylglucosaminyltransferase
MKIIDGFSFYNELDMLECRLDTMNDSVDQFILVEATHSHAGKEKPLFYEENKERYAKWAHKIIHVIVRDMPRVFPNVDYEKDEQWKNEHHQRNCIERGLEGLDLSPDDILLVSDLDEIFNPRFLAKVRSREVPVYYTGVMMDCYYYNLHNFMTPYWVAARLITLKAIKELNRTLTELRLNDARDANIIHDHGGWHFSYFGDTAFIKNKLLNFAHQEFNTAQYTSEERIDTRVRERKSLFGDGGCHTPIIYIPVPSDRPLPQNYETYLRKFYASP